MDGEAPPEESPGRPARSRATTTLQVEIFGSTYQVRSDTDPKHLEELASLVDEKMREIAQRTKAVETSRIAILAALNLADELVRSRRQGGSEEGRKITQRANGLLDQLEKVLDR